MEKENVRKWYKITTQNGQVFECFLTFETVLKLTHLYKVKVNKNIK